MKERIGELTILIGTNGTGKSTLMKRLLAVNERNLILPANRLDPAWDQLQELTTAWEHRPDPRDHRGKRMQPFKAVPGMKTFIGNRKLFIDEPETFEAVTDQDTGFVNGGLFLDDFRNYIPSKGSLPGHVTAMLSSRRHRMLDIFAACHSFQDINVQLLQFNPRLVVGFVTLPPNESVSEKVANFAELMEVYHRVRRVNEERGTRHYFEEFKPA